MTQREKPVMAMSVSTGWVVRNLFQTGVVAGLREKFRLLVITTPTIHENLVRHGYAAGLEVVVRTDLDEPRSWRYLRQIKKKLYMDSRHSATDAIWEKYVRRPFYQKLGGAVISGTLRLLDARRLLSIAETADLRLNNSEIAERILEQYGPVLLFATHASSYFEESLLHAAIRMKVPVVFMVLSWDHLSSKVVLSGRYARVLVWNPVTKSEILQTTDAYAPEQIEVVGVPQFDCYAERPSISYEEWCRKYGLDPTRRTIVFSTMPQVRHDQQHIVIEGLLDAIRLERELPAALQVLIKCHPFDNTNKYDFLLARGYPVGICRSTLPVGAVQDEWFPSAEEMYVSRDALYFCSVNVNIFSTVTLEAAFLDKPIVHIAYDPYPVENRIPCREYYNFDHFRNITASGASILVERDADLAGAIRTSLECPEQRAANRRVLVQEYFHDVRTSAAATVVARIGEAARELPDRGDAR